jgi:D-beta-D-heptose 7-phosphate kinase/D-beta-D-heptose 1-phosphate adenosyltransferase
MIKILVIGEKCTDRFIYCDVFRLSPEAPVPVLNPIKTIENDGMSGNVVRNLLSLNSNILITHWYQDEVITKTRFIEKKSNHMFIRLDEGENKISHIELNSNRMLEISEFDIVIVSDYNKGFINDDELSLIGEFSKLSILDSKRKLNDKIINNYTFVKLNEFESFYNKDVISKHDNIITTLGSRGAKFKDKIYPSNNPKETIDVSGAGDTFTASFILKYQETSNIEESIIFANEMSSIVVSKRGTAVPK